jgi:formylglycine-generating enzyme required for sulfatase activity
MSNQETNFLGVASLSAVLKQAQFDLDGEEIADLLWLAAHMGKVEITNSNELPTQENQKNPKSTNSENLNKSSDISLETIPPVDIPRESEPSAFVNLPVNETQSPKKSQTTSGSMPFKAPAAPALRNPLALARALRPLMRKVSSQTKQILDEEETVNQFAEKRILMPVLKPAPERWLDLALVIEKSRSIIIWQEIITEFQKLTELQGAFRSVCTWSLESDEKGEIKLFPQQNLSTNQQLSRSPKELLDSTGRRLILLVSDCTSEIWRQGKIHQILKLWSSSNPLAIVQLFPEQLWMRTALGFGYPVQLNALTPGLPNTKLTVEGLPVWEDVDITKAVTLPIITLEPDFLRQWSRVLAGQGSTKTAGIVLDASLIPNQSQEFKKTNQLSANELVNRFRATASPTARRLAGLMATVPVSMPVVHLIQETLLKESMQVHVAEVFMSGILEPITDSNLSLERETTENKSVKKQIVNYKFVNGVRELLIDSVATPDVDRVLEAVSQYIARKAGISIKDFTALLSSDIEWDTTIEEEIKSFAKITKDVLYRLGGEYAAFAETLEEKPFKSLYGKSKYDLSKDFPLEEFNFRTAKITISDSEEEDNSNPPINLQPFEFEVATIEVKKSGNSNTELIINRSRRQTYSFIENLSAEISLEMVQIPGGSFMMGALKSEKDSRNNERPQHKVTVPAFFMGKYPITQAQWKEVASLPQINRELKTDPSDFKGDNRPVESVSWSDAVEFCQRLSQHTKREYRLPSEAEWEYACRGRTTTPFHFGETITSDLANYNAEYTYGAGEKGIYRKETTEVGSFGVANDFGLYDMHGNVWEWCEDDWHSDYEGAPTDGSAWIDNENDNHSYVLRGGSWLYDPEDCRSAFRGYYNLNHYVGFRVVCVFLRKS